MSQILFSTTSSINPKDFIINRHITDIGDDVVYRVSYKRLDEYTHLHPHLEPVVPQLEEWLEKIQNHKTVSKGSAIKFALVAEGKLDIYPRTSPTYEWDSAAGQAIVEGSGGKVLQLYNKKLIYGRSNRLNPNFVAFGRSNWSEFLLE